MVLFLYSGLIDEDNQQVFDCSSVENTDTENEDSDFDDPMDIETDVELNKNTNKNSDSEHSYGVEKAPYSSYKKYLDENGINFVHLITHYNMILVPYIYFSIVFLILQTI